MDPVTRMLEIEYRQKTEIKYISKAYFGNYLYNTWYYSPYPTEVYSKAETIYVCNQCMKYMVTPELYREHYFQRQCPRYDQLPGKVMYSDTKNNIVICCVDGSEDKLFCQNLNLFCKFFIDHKTVYFDIERFMFYMIYKVSTEEENKPQKYEFAGYFSKVIKLFLICFAFV